MEKKFEDLRWREISACFGQKNHGSGSDFRSGEVLRNLGRDKSTKEETYSLKDQTGLTRKRNGSKCS